jgi:all-trans-retinol 13,14-reductase
VIAQHYARGGYYPVGGAGTIATSILPIIESAGGACLLNHKAREVIIKGGKVAGVKAAFQRGRTSEEVAFYAPVVISDAGAYHTYTKLLAGEPRINAAAAEAKARVSQAYSVANLFIGFKESPEKLGVRGENRWLFSGYDHDKLFRQRNELLNGNVGACYVSFPSLKDPAAVEHVAEVIAPLDFEAVEHWCDKPWRKRGEDYRQLKEIVSDALVRFVERQCPGFRDLIAYQELATPLSVISLTGHDRGAIYGLPASPERFCSKWLQPRTPIPGMYLTGSDAAVHGVAGALMGGVLTASLLLPGMGFFKILSAAKDFSKRRR